MAEQWKSRSEKKMTDARRAIWASKRTH